MKNQVHAVIAAARVPVTMSDVFGAEGATLLDRVPLGTTQRARVDSLRRLIDMLDFEIDTLTRLTAARVRADPGYLAVQTIPGIGPILAAGLVAEIGDITRFARPEQLTSWAGLTPRRHESDTTVHRGRITKQASRLVRRAAVEAVQRAHPGTRIGARRDRVAVRRGRNIGAVGHRPRATRAGLLRPALSPRPARRSRAAG